MTNKHMKGSSYSLVIREIQIKTTICYHYTCTRMAKKKQLKSSVGKNVKQLEISNEHFGKLVLTMKVQHRHPSNPTPRCLPNRNVHDVMWAKRHTQNVHDNSPNSQKLDLPKCPSIVEQIKKYSVVTQWSSNTAMRMNDPQLHTAIQINLINIV